MNTQSNKSRSRGIALNGAQARQLLAAVNRRSPFGERDFALIIFLFHTGLRVSELSGLNVHDVVTREGTAREVLHLRAETAKGRQSRLVPLNAVARKAITSLVSFNRSRGFSVVPGAPLLVNRKHRRLPVRAIQYLFEGLREKAQLDIRATPHTARHSFCSAVVRKSGDIRSLQTIVGHASLRSTEVYLHPDAEDLARTVRSLEGGSR